MKILGFAFLGLCFVALGITAAKLGWFDAVVNWVKGW